MSEFQNFSYLVVTASLVAWSILPFDRTRDAVMRDPSAAPTGDDIV